MKAIVHELDYIATSRRSWVDKKHLDMFGEYYHIDTPPKFGVGWNRVVQRKSNRKGMSERFEMTYRELPHWIKIDWVSSTECCGRCGRNSSWICLPSSWWRQGSTQPLWGPRGEGW